jgi:S1-C subfamily serine protease
MLDERPTRDRPPHRTWRDLPPSPPLGATASLAPPDPSTYVGTTTYADATTYVDATTEVEMPRPATAAPTTPAGSPDAPGGGSRRNLRRALIAGGIVAVVLAVGVGIVVARDAGSDARSGGTSTPTLPGTAAGSPADVAAALGPAVVQIEIAGGLDAGGGVGSGVIYDSAGLVLTAHHVVAISDEVVVKDARGRTYNGRVVGRLPDRDLAVVALDGASDLIAATIAEPGSVEVGEPAVALGSPFGYQASVTAGIISGLDRELETPAGVLTGLIQTDAPINPGNSGGPLADADAKVIGINTAIASMSGGNDGVGFAVPVEQFQELLDQVAQAGGVDAPTVPAPENSDGGLGGLIPGLDDILPGLDDILPGLDDIIPGLDDILPNGQLPSLDELLEDLFGDILPGPIEDLLKDLLPGGEG